MHHTAPQKRRDDDDAHNRVELAHCGITVNNIAPGAIDTPMDAALKDNQQQMAALLDEIPLRRLGEPEEVASLATFLASDEAAYVTGSSYFIDGACWPGNRICSLTVLSVCDRVLVLYEGQSCESFQPIAPTRQAVACRSWAGTGRWSGSVSASVRH